MMRNIALLFLFALSLTACDKELFFESSKAFPEGLWAYQDSVDFRFSVTDTAQHYNLYLDFTYADTFSTQNIYLKLYTLFPDGKRLSKVKSFDLFDAQGNARGKCSGHTCTARLPLQENAYFNRPGEYLITLEQYTRTEALAGIKKVGLTLTRAKQQQTK